MRVHPWFLNKEDVSSRFKRYFLRDVAVSLGGRIDGVLGGPAGSLVGDE